MGPAPEPNLTVLYSSHLPENFKKYAAHISVETSSIQYENDDVMRPVWGDDYSICCCVSATETGKEIQFFGARANLAKCLLYAINGGMDEKTHDQVAPEYAPITSEYLDYDEVMKKYDVMMDWLAHLYVGTLNMIHYMHDKYYYEAAEMALIDTKVEQVATGLGLLAIGLDRPIAQMSGGQRAKVILAKLLLEKPDVLLLDEPTNFLDKEHVDWLSEYLCGLNNAFMVVSHDYAFLEKISNRICDIDNHKITKYYGTYSEFLRKKTALREDYIRQYSAQQKEIKKTEEFIRKNIAGRKSKMARGRQKQLDRMDKMEAIDQKEIIPFFHFREMPLTNTEHLNVKHLSVGYHYPVLSDINFTVNGGQKVVITGFNGIGKSTLLKTLVGQLSALNGSFSFSEQVKLRYFEQDLHWENEEKTPIQIVSDCYPSLTIKEVRKNLACCGIMGEHAMQAIGTLSGGEQAKVKICLLILTPCNFIIMDEPTNHLDIQAKQSLKIALKEFKGTVLLVSHEPDFYKEWVQKIISIENIIKKR